jgi:hypothetical protein
MNANPARAAGSIPDVDLTKPAILNVEVAIPSGCWVMRSNSLKIQVLIKTH